MVISVTDYCLLLERNVRVAGFVGNWYVDVLTLLFAFSVLVLSLELSVSSSYLALKDRLFLQGDASLDTGLDVSFVNLKEDAQLL